MSVVSPTVDLMESTDGSARILARARRLAVWGCLLLFVVSPLMLGAWITVAVRLADGGSTGAGTYALMVVWALVCLVALLFGFALFLGGVYLWWRSRNPRAVVRTTSDSDRRTTLLKELQEELRVQRAGDSVEPADHSMADPAQRADDSAQPGHPR